MTVKGKQIEAAANPTATDIVTKSYVDRADIAGRGWREPVLVAAQLTSGGSGGIRSAILAFIRTNPSDGDTFIIKNGSTTETYTFRASPSGGFDVQIGGSAALTMANLVAKIVSASAAWAAVNTVGLGIYFGFYPTNQFVVMRKTTANTADRIYGTLTAPSGISTVKFNNADAQDYATAAGTEENLPATDPGIKTFGFRRPNPLIEAETHIVVDDLSIQSWDDVDGAWVITATVNYVDSAVARTPKVLATVGGIDATAMGATSLYTVPAGKTLVVTGLVIRATTVSVPISNASGSVGQNGAINDIFPIAVIPLTDVVTAFIQAAIGSVALTVAAGTVQFKITTPAVATGLVLAVDLIGYLF